MGTPEFAVASLDALVAGNFNIAAVITAPDKPKGRGQKLIPSPVKKAALSHQIPVLQPTNLKDPGFLKELKALQADLQIVVAFRMLPEAVWAMPPLGTFNLHASLLPQYRGAAPINWTIINGEQETGVTTFFLKHEIDTGPLIFQEKEPIHPNDDAGSLYSRLMQKGAELVVKTAHAIAAGNYSEQVQMYSGTVKTAPKIYKETCEINWDQPREKIRDFIRGLSPYPGAWTTHSGKNFKIFKAEIPTEKTSDEPSIGTWKTDEKSFVYVNAQDGWISILELQPEGKRRMTIGEFLRGNTIKNSTED